MSLDRELIARGGSKLETTRALIEEGVDLPIPESVFIYEGDDLSKHEAEIGRLFRLPHLNQLIARGSNVADHDAGIDTYKTVKGITSWSELERAIKDIRNAGKDPRLQTYCKDWDVPYDPRVHVLLQQQKSHFTGTMLRHPNLPSLIVMEYSLMGNHVDSATFYLRHNTLVSNIGSAKIHDDGFIEVTERNEGRHTPAVEDLVQAVQMYLKFEKSSVVDPEYTYVVEFGMQPQFFFQGKPFKRIDGGREIMKWDGEEDIHEHIANVDAYHGRFKLPLFEPGVPVLSGDHQGYGHVYGNTPREGIAIKFNPAGIHEDHGLAVARIYSFEPHDSLQELGNLRFFTSGNFVSNEGANQQHSYLHHAHYMFMKRADVTIVDPYMERDDSSKRLKHGQRFDIPPEFNESRVFASGGRALVVPEKYLDRRVE